MAEDILSMFFSQAGIAWLALGGCGIFVLYIMLKKFGLV